MPCTRSPAVRAHHDTARACAAARSGKSSPAKNEPRTYCTVRCTFALSFGERTRAGSVKNPLAWAYSSQPTVNVGLVGSASDTTGLRLSGITTLNTPPKNSHAASHPAITAVSVWVNVSQTKVCRECAAVKINACATRRRPATGSQINPIRAKSIWHSTPGSPSATRTVTPCRPAPQRSTA